MSSVKSWFNSWCLRKQKGNNDQYNEGRLYNNFSLLAKNRFKWEGLPEGVESRHIEQFLYEEGQVAFVEDEQLGFLVLPCTSNGLLNVYNEPLGFQVTGNGYSKTFKSDDMVRILANDNATPDCIQVAHYTRLIDELEKTSFMNIRQQRFPWLIGTTKETELTMRNIFNKIDNFEEQIFVDSKLTAGGNMGSEVLNLNVPYVVDKIRTEKNEIISELLSWLGLNNSANNKKERLIVDEINVNNNYILMNLDIEYKTRQKACELINEKYGLNVSVIRTIDELDVNFLGQLDGEDPKENDKKKGWFL